MTAIAVNCVDVCLLLDKLFPKERNSGRRRIRSRYIGAGDHGTADMSQPLWREAGGGGEDDTEKESDSRQKAHGEKW